MLFLSCQGQNKKIETYGDIPVQHLERRDSLFMVYTINQYILKKFSVYGSYNHYGINNVDIQIGRIFYDSNKSKIVCWVIVKVKNNKSDCHIPISYSGTGLIGFKDSITHLWKLFPFLNKQAICFNTSTEVLNELAQYYFGKMKHTERYKIVQNSSNKGKYEYKEYGYNLQDNGFWTKCWLWQKDTVGTYNLYPFEVNFYGSGYYADTTYVCNKCAYPFEVPTIVYPDFILKMYK